MEIKPLIKMKRTNKLSGRCNRLYLIMRSKFLLSFFLLVLVPFCILAVIIQVKSIYSVMELQSKNTVVNIDRYFNDIEKISDVLAKDEFVRSIKGNPAQITDVNISLNKEVISLKDYMKMKISSFTDANISSVSYYSILSNKPAVLYTKFSNIIVNNDSWSKNWVSYFENNADKTEYIGTALQFFDNGRNEYIFSTAKAVKNIESGKFDGIIKIDFDYNDLNKIISSSISLNTKNNETYLVKSDGDSDDPNDVFANTIMYSNNKGVLTSEISANILDMIGEEKSDTQFSLPEEHGPTFITYRTCSSLPWKFIQIYPAISILGDSYFIDFKWSIIILICFILIFVFLFVVRSVLLKPINRLTTVITEYEKGSFPTHTNLDITENNTDTPVRINQKSNVDNLINMVYYNQLKQKEAELNSLQSKINPHFLYNTLESIRGAALYHGIDSIAQMSKSLSLLFRYSINKNVVVTAREEIDNLNNYITIQNFRHDDKFNVILNIPDKAYDYKMLKMILQPIVENCIKHGLEMKLGKGTIRISIFDYGSIIKIEVCDDGDGISDEKIDELNKLMTEGDTTDVNDNQTAEGTGIGLQNVNSRIKLYFGNQYGVKICKADSGTTVEVILPVVE